MPTLGFAAPALVNTRSGRCAGAGAAGRLIDPELPVAGAQFGLTAASTALLPSVLGVPVETVYLATVAALAIASFLMFRYVIFHARPTVQDPNRVPVVKEDWPRPDA